MWKCAVCGNENEETANICESCGNEKGTEEAPSPNKKRNLIIGIILAAILVAGIIWLIFGFLINPGGADGLSNAQSYTELMDAADNMNEKGVAFEANGVKISEDDWNHYFMTMAKNYANSQGKYLDEIDWTAKDENGQTVLEKIKYEALDEVIRMAAVESKAEEWGISLTETELSMVDINWDYWVQVYGDDIYEELDIKDKAEFEKIEKRRLLNNKIWDTVNADIEKYAGNTEDLKNYTNDSSATIQIIEIAKAETGTDAKTQIEEAKARIDGGEAFGDVWLDVMGEQYLQMTGIEKTKPDSIAIAKGSVADEYKEIETTALSLEIGQVSGVIETNYSYAIICRVAGYTELVNKLVNKLVAEGEIGVNKEIIEASKIK